MRKQELIHALRCLQARVFSANKEDGWHNNLNGTERTKEEQRELFPTRIALIHSEASEALEGFRKNLEDDHIKGRDMAEIELADIVIRTFDLAGAMDYDIASAIIKKLKYNKNRADHKPENRQKTNGKKF